MNKLVVLLMALSMGAIAQEKKVYMLEPSDSAKGKQLWIEKEKAAQAYQEWTQEMSAKLSGEDLNNGYQLPYVYRCYADLEFTQNFKAAISKGDLLGSCTVVFATADVTQ